MTSAEPRPVFQAGGHSDAGTLQRRHALRQDVQWPLYLPEVGTALWGLFSMKCFQIPMELIEDAFDF